MHLHFVKDCRFPLLIPCYAEYMHIKRRVANNKYKARERYIPRVYKGATTWPTETISQFFEDLVD
jgi:hypothetical protein